jgi:hypothetical protein
MENHLRNKRSWNGMKINLWNTVDLKLNTQSIYHAFVLVKKMLENHQVHGILIQLLLM